MSLNGESPWLRSPWPLNFLLTGVAAAWLLLAGNPFEPLALRWFDQCLRWRHDWHLADKVDSRIIHLDITEEDLKKLPSPEEEYRAAARLIQQASELGAEVLVFDILYGRGTPEMAAPILEAIQASQAKIVLAEAFGLGGRVFSFPHLPDRLSPAGLINVRPDADGIYRRYSFLHKGAQGPEPSLALASYFALNKISSDEIDFSDPQAVSWRELSKDGKVLVPRKIFLKEQGRNLLDMRSGWSAEGPEAFGHLSLAGLERLFLETQEKGRGRPHAGKILFISYVAAGMSDFGATPFGAHQPLVQLHSAALNDLIQRTGHYRLPRWADSLPMLFLLLMGVIARSSRTKWILSFFWFLGAGAILITGLAMVLKTGWLPPVIAVTFLWLFAFVVELFRRHSLEFIARLKMRMTIGYYFSPRVLEKILENPGWMEPQQVEVTVLLSDLRNFTLLGERLGTRGLFDLLNRIFAEQIKAVMAEDATLEHFVGDQFMCYWGAPDPVPDRADRALRGTLNLMKAMEALREGLAPGVREFYGYGAALHSGRAMIGNIGSLDRMDYGVMGDLINTASRVESLTKRYGVPFIMTRETYDQLTERPSFRLLDTIVPTGKSTPLDLLEIKHAFSPPSFETLAAGYKTALEEYRRGHFSLAAKQFQALFDNFKDPASRQMARRSQDLEAHPPSDWSGIYKFDTK